MPVSTVCVPFPLGVWGRMWNSIVSVPDHCLFINLFPYIVYGEPNKTTKISQMHQLSSYTNGKEVLRFTTTIVPSPFFSTASPAKLLKCTLR